MTYLNSPWFTDIIEPNQLNPNQEYLIDYSQIHRAKKYLDFNYLIVINLSVAVIEIRIDDNPENKIIVPPGSSIQLDNETFSKLRLKNISSVSNDKHVIIQSKKEITEKQLLQAIAEKLDALKNLKLKLF